MVKGISRQVIVVRPDTDLFEQAIFILKDQGPEGGVTDEQILRQARQAADSYLRDRGRGGRGKKFRLRPVFSALLGALCVAVLWAVWALVL